MILNVRFVDESEHLPEIHESNEIFPTNFGEVQTITSLERDYNNLINKPSINSITLEGALTAEDIGLGRVYYDTRENWDGQANLIAEKSVIYIYSNYEYIVDDVGNRTPVAGMKIGDGTSYLIDMPFTSDSVLKMVIDHITDQNSHVSEYDRLFWNNKVSTVFNDGEPENLVFSKTRFVID